MSSIMKGLVDETEAKKGADGKRCWKGKRYAGTENGKDKCIPVKEGTDTKWEVAVEYGPTAHDSVTIKVSAPDANTAQNKALALFKKKYPDKRGMIGGYTKLDEGVIVGHDANDPEVAILGGAGTMSLSRLKKKAHAEALQLADDIANGKYSASSYNMKQLHNTLNTIVAAEKEMEQSYFGEARQPHPLLKAVNKNLVDLASGEVRRREASRKAAEKGQKAASKELARLNKPKKPTLDQIWQKIEHAISNYFPDGDPTDYLNPYMQKTGITWDDITRACKKQGYSDLWDYWNTLAQDIENDAYYDWHATGGKNVRHRAPFMETPTDNPTGSSGEGGWRKYSPKSAGTVEEDTAYAGGMGQGHSGESYRKFKPKSAGTFKESACRDCKHGYPADICPECEDEYKEKHDKKKQSSIMKGIKGRK